jgi:thymidylate synthase (FAD)
MTPPSERAPQLYVVERPRKLLTHPSGMSVELLDWMGSDLSIVNAARVSYGNESRFQRWRYNRDEERFTTHSGDPMDDRFDDWRLCLSERDAGLINYLARERHGTPFEMVQFQFRVKAPIGVVWEWVRHRISSYNIMSTRYVEWDKDYYTPEAEDWREQVGKTGHYLFTQMDHAEVHPLYVEAMEQAFRYYGMLVERGLAKEVARNVLPMGAMTQMIWSVNARSLFNFLGLRTAPNALREIQFCASMVEQLAEPIIPEALQAWRRHDKRVP